jgi:hypothetical protein
MSAINFSCHLNFSVATFKLFGRTFCHLATVSILSILPLPIAFLPYSFHFFQSSCIVVFVFGKNFEIFLFYNVFKILVLLFGADSDTPARFDSFLNASLEGGGSGSSSLPDRVLYLTHPGSGFESRADVTVLPATDLFQEPGSLSFVKSMINLFSSLQSRTGEKC